MGHYLNYYTFDSFYIIKLVPSMSSYYVARAIEMMNTVKNRTPKGKKIPNC